jgi:hypothetical protein
LAALLCGTAAGRSAEAGATPPEVATEWELDWAWQYPNGQPRPARKPVDRVFHPLALTRVDAQHEVPHVVVARTRALLADLAGRQVAGGAQTGKPLAGRGCFADPDLD